MCHVEQQMGIRPCVLLDWVVVLGSFAAVRLRLVGVVRFGKGVVEVYRLGDDQRERHASSGCEWVRSDTADRGQPCSQGWTEGESDRKACSYQGHRLASVLVSRDIGRDGERELNIALTQSSHNTTGQERAEVCSSAPQSY